MNYTHILITYKLLDLLELIDDTETTKKNDIITIYSYFYGQCADLFIGTTRIHIYISFLKIYYCTMTHTNHANIFKRITNTDVVKQEKIF